MPQRTLRFRITQDGLVEESVEGVHGEACYQLTEKLEEALGVVDRRVETADAYSLQEVQAKQSISAEQFL